MKPASKILVALGLLGGMGVMPLAVAAPAPMTTPSQPTPQAQGTPAPMPSNAPSAMSGKLGAADHATTNASATKSVEPREEWNHQTAVLQEALNSTGAHLAIDGVWGRKTEKALRDYQRAHGLAVTGKLDAPTRKTLDPIG